MNINLSMEEIQIIREALQDSRAKAQTKRDEALKSADFQEGIEVMLTEQRLRAIHATLQQVQSEAGKHFTGEMLKSWLRATA
jgi:hypothetical protein